MADVALKAGIAWKKAVVQDLLLWAVAQLNRDAADPTGQGQARIPADLALIARYAQELQTLDGPDKKEAWKLVRGNLKNHLETAREALAHLNGILSGREHIWPEDEGRAELHRTIEDLERKLKALEAEGSP